MTLRTRTDDKTFTNDNLAARTYMTFSERNGIVSKKRNMRVIFVDIMVENEFRICFEI